MTVTMTKAPSQPAALWSTSPGWGIVADLTPPELINSREVRRLQRYIAAGLVAILLAAAGGFVLAQRTNTAASVALAAEQARAAPLQAVARKYQGISTIQGSVSSVQAQIASVMGGDVDMDALMTKLVRALPPGMTISSETVTIALAGVAGASRGLDISGLSRIGSVTLTGGARALTDLSSYVDRLKVIPGLTDVVPTSNIASKTGVQYNLTTSLTSRSLSHRYDVPKAGQR